jgi:hypothetical protein
MVLWFYGYTGDLKPKSDNGEVTVAIAWARGR